MNAANMSFPSALASKAGTAVLARVRLVAGMGVHVVLQVFRQDKALPASWANVGSEVLRGVLEQDVTPHASIGTGGETAGLALLLLAVNIGHVILQQLLVVEGLGAARRWARDGGRTMLSVRLYF